MLTSIENAVFILPILLFLCIIPCFYRELIFGFSLYRAINSIELQQNWLIHFVRHYNDLVTARFKNYIPFAVARYQISISCYIAIVHFLFVI